MKTLSEILNGIKIIDIKGNLDISIKGISNNSKQIEKNYLFICIIGSYLDGHNYIEDAINNGATVVVYSNNIQEYQNNVTYIKVNYEDNIPSILSSNFYCNPSYNIKLIGITGTNGKTTTVSLLYELFIKLGYKCILISTIEIIIDNKKYPTSNTTPDIIFINRILKEGIDKGCQYAFMEVSSHGIIQKRIEGLKFTMIGFTNISQDHLDYHKTFLNYLNAKKKFFDSVNKDCIAISNLDDKNGNYIVQNTKAKKVFYSFKKISDYKGKIIEHTIDGTLLNFNGEIFWSPLIGTFNCYNLLLVYTVYKELFYNKNYNIINVLSSLYYIKGRFHKIVFNNGINVIVDYAHTPDAVDKILSCVLKFKQKRSRIITVIGCGGNRDKTKRRIIGKISYIKSDILILTSDNPRNEEPTNIISDMMKDIINNIKKNKPLIIIDRKEAILHAISIAIKYDIILILGKGHECYQEIKGIKYYFSDLDILYKLKYK